MRERLEQLSGVLLVIALSVFIFWTDPKPEPVPTPAKDSSGEWVTIQQRQPVPEEASDVEVHLAVDGDVPAGATDSGDAGESVEWFVPPTILSEPEKGGDPESAVESHLPTPQSAADAPESEAAPLTASGASSYDLLYFTADWCPACRNETPVVKRLEGEYSIRTIDCDKFPDEVKRYGIKQIPAFVTVADGKVHEGQLSRRQLLRLLGKADDAPAGNAIRQATLARVMSNGKAYGTCVCIGRLGDETLYGMCDHQTGGELQVMGRPARLLWQNRDGINDAAIVAVAIERQPGTLRTMYEGRASIYGYPGLGEQMRGFSGTADRQGFLTGPVPAFARQGVSGGGVYAPDGTLIGIFSGYVTKRPTQNTFTPIIVYVKAIEELGGTCDVRSSDPVPQGVSQPPVYEWSTQHPVRQTYRWRSRGRGRR